MLSKVGLARLECSGCQRVSFHLARALLQANVASCHHCFEAVSVADLEARDPELGRVLGVLRQLAAARTIHRQRQEAGATEAQQAAADMDAQLA